MCQYFSSVMAWNDIYWSANEKAERCSVHYVDSAICENQEVRRLFKVYKPVRSILYLILAVISGLHIRRFLKQLPEQCENSHPNTPISLEIFPDSSVSCMPGGDRWTTIRIFITSFPAGLSIQIITTGILRIWSSIFLYRSCQNLWNIVFTQRWKRRAWSILYHRMPGSRFVFLLPG